MIAQRPQSRVLSLDFRGSDEADWRIGCGLIDIDGFVEPVSVIAKWRNEPGVVVTIAGMPPLPPKSPYWEIEIGGPTRADRNLDGEIGWLDRSLDGQGRRTVQMLCPDLSPPAGVTWMTEIEPNPDPVRAERARRRAQATSDLIFGRQSGSTPPNPH